MRSAIALDIEGAALLELERKVDDRGFFEEILRASDAIMSAGFAQWSWCERETGVITAWHVHPTQWDWWFIPFGRAKVALHDLRRDSGTQARTVELVLGAGGPDRVLAVPPGVAHGYRVLEGPMYLFYVTSREYNAASPAPPHGEEGRIPHDDPSIGYDWMADPAT